MVVLGVLVVALSSRGHQIVFRYPLDAARDRPPPELLLAPAAAAAPAAPPPQQRLHTPAHSRRGSDAPQSKTASTYLGFDCGFLSDVLSPKLALRDRPFHLSIDSIDFVGLPTQLNANRPGTGLRFARLVQKRKAVAAVRAHEATAAAAAAADRGAAALPAHQHPLAAASAAAQSSASVSGQPDNPPPVASPALSLHTLDPHPSAVPRGPGAQGLPPAASAPPHKPLRAGTQSQLTMFNLVFAMQADSHSGSNYDLEMAAIYDNVIAKVTAALKYEQLRRGYLRKETELILAIKDEYHARHAAHAPASHTNQAGMPSPASDDHEQLEQHLQLLILRQSSLARCVAHIYHALRGQMSPHLQINDSVSLTIRTHGLTPDTLQLADIPLIDEPAPDSLKQLPKLRPYLALLLLHHPEEIIAMLPADASPLLVELIQAVTPTLS
nr:Nitrogen permease regulator-like 3 [Polyrhizophydium stewartii]